MKRKESIQIIQLKGKRQIRGVLQVRKGEGRRGTQEQVLSKEVLEEEEKGRRNCCL